ncbi:hypothetical protein Rhe02_30120 [Rhizocola hellebori]|uniref:HEAT repeat domain-containing protein n=2 Tax=Rhizocola hellebori TaxID=1392758 RepID=A0A8J3VFZ0_9ACTN|nr:hypothetical protein Rhe02_30120 [Rhizocola hellebori]
MSPEALLGALSAARPTRAAAEIAAALLSVSRDGDISLRAEVAEALAELAASRWLAIDEALRNQLWAVPDLAHGEPEVLRLLVAACHPDGRLREAAVIRMAGPIHPATAAVLAIRACDWVSEVRTAARGVIEGWPSPPSGPALTSLTAMAFALQARRAGGWLVARVELLLQDVPAQHLEPLLTAADRRTRRAAYRAATAAGRLSPDRLMRAAVNDADLPIRIMCARAAMLATPDLPVLRALFSSHSAVVRAEALTALAARGHLAETEAALADRHPLVRETAQGALRRAGVDLAAAYRQLVAMSPPRPGALAGLGETGAAEDADLLTPSLADPRPAARVEAIRAMRRLGVIRVQALVPLLNDEFGGVTRQAVFALRQHAATLDPALLNTMLDPDNPWHIRFAGYRLLVAGDVWQRLITNLRLIQDEDDRLRNAARSDIGFWLDSDAATAYRGPAPHQFGELAKLIDQALPVLGRDTTRLLRFHIG